MNRRRCLRIAERLQSPFEGRLGISIDPQRMLADSSYAQDVLTVCEAQAAGSLLPTLARQFRLAAAEADAGDSLPAPDSSVFGADSTGFGATRPQTNSVFDQERQAARAARKSPGWMSPGRWLGHDT